MSKDTQFDFNQLFWRRSAAYDQRDELLNRLKVNRSVIEDLKNDDLKHTDPADIADVEQQMERIGFLKSEIHYNNVSGETERFALEEIKTRTDILYKKLDVMSEHRGPGWQVMRDATKEQYDIIDGLTKVEETIQHLDHSYFTHIEYDKHHPSSPPPEIPDDEFERMMQESELTEKELYALDREAWDHEKTWMEIDAEAVRRANVELEKVKEDADDFKERMMSAMALEKDIEEKRRELERAVKLLLDVQRHKGNTLSLQIQEEQHFSENSASLNSQISDLEDFFDDIIPSFIWPDYIMGKPSQSAYPEPAQDFQDSLNGTMSFEEQQEFFSKQEQLKDLRKRRLQADKHIEERRAYYLNELNANSVQDKELRAQVDILRHDLNMLNGQRGAALQVAVPRIIVAGEDEITPSDGVSATVEVQGVSAKVEVGSSMTVSAEVVKKATENTEEQNTLEEELIATDKRGDALAKMALRLIHKVQVNNPEDLHKEYKGGKYERYNIAVNALNEQHKQGKLTGTVRPFIVNKDKHAGAMLAFRCGVDIRDMNKERKIELEVVSRGDYTNNSVWCYFPKWATTGLIAVYPNKAGDWVIYTGKHYDDEWVDYALTTPGVPPFAKADEHSIEEYLKFHWLIQERIDAETAEKKGPA